MIKKNLFKKTTGVITVLTAVLFSSVAAFAGTDMYVGGARVACDVSIDGEYVTARMDSSWEMEMWIDGYAYNVYGGYPIYAHSENTYGISTSEHSEIGFKSADITFKAETFDSDYNTESNTITIHE